MDYHGTLAQGDIKPQSDTNIVGVDVSRCLLWSQQI